MQGRKSQNRKFDHHQKMRLGWMDEDTRHKRKSEKKLLPLHVKLSATRYELATYALLLSSVSSEPHATNSSVFRQASAGADACEEGTRRDVGTSSCGLSNPDLSGRCKQMSLRGHRELAWVPAGALIFF